MLIEQAAVEPQKTCRTCGGDYHVSFFAPKRATCRGCVQTARDRKKWRENRFPSKVQWARRSHARRLHRSAVELRTRFGWTDAAMMRDARDVWWNGCPCCRRPVCRIRGDGGTMTHSQAEYTDPVDGVRIPPGLFTLVLRIRDRQAEPTYDTNTLWVCRFCAWARGHVARGGAMVTSRDGRPPEGTSPRACKHCGAMFTPTYAVQCFCRPSCRRAHCAPRVGAQSKLPLDDPATLFDVGFEPGLNSDPGAGRNLDHRVAPPPCSGAPRHQQEGRGRGGNNR